MADGQRLFEDRVGALFHKAQSVEGLLHDGGGGGGDDAVRRRQMRLLWSGSPHGLPLRPFSATASPECGGDTRHVRESGRRCWRGKERLMIGIHLLIGC
ncbi:hypothetical protein E2C01_000035 [Portunus trituberculatus]|uniref:Uncharacterized protein n=1 Tax=Portunus trituberculatus TaxID=210409 RepID=A0A5B7CII9_PORTR|nr:hypothetical protein [Portunus trituberculatus]